MPLPSLRRSARKSAGGGRVGRALGAAAAAGMLAALLVPGVAVAEGPGYGGSADTLTVRWQDGADARQDGDVLAIYAVGFRGSSPVALRIGAAAERVVTADPVGALRVLVVSDAAPPASSTAGALVLPIGEAMAGRLSPGTSVQAIGQTPAAGARVLLGAVPPPAAGGGLRDLLPWLAAAALPLVVGLVRARSGSRRRAAYGYAGARTPTRPVCGAGSPRARR